MKNLIHAHIDSRDILLAIIILGTGVSGGETVFNDGENMNDIGKRAHVLKHSHGRCVIGSLNKVLHEGSIWTGHRSVLLFILHKSILIHFLHNGTRFYEKYIPSKHKKKYIDDDGSGVFPKQQVRKKYISKYQLTYSNRYYVMKNDSIKDTRIRWTYSGRKRKATGYVLITGSPYCDAEGYPQKISCLHDAIINSDSRIGQFFPQFLEQH